MERDLDLLAAAAVTFTIRPSQRFIDEGEQIAHFFTLISGTASLFKALPDGRQQITSFAGSGDFLGVSGSSHYAYSAEAIDEVKLCRFSRQRLRELAAEFPVLERRLFEMTCNELELAQEQMLLLGRKSARERVASFLIMRAAKTATRETGTPQTGTPQTGKRRPATRQAEARQADARDADAEAPTLVLLPMSRGAIGDYLGLTLETVSRMLSHLKALHLITAAPDNGIVIIDFVGLQARAMGD